MKDLTRTIIENLVKDYKFKQNGQFLQQGVCPSCNKKELWGNAFFIKCNRLNSCNFEDEVENIYPELFTNFNEVFKPTPANPKSAAAAYLYYVRGIDAKKIDDFYQMGEFAHPRANKKTYTLRFFLDSEKKIFMERFVEEVQILDENKKPTSRRANFFGSHAGLAWQPPKQKIGDSVYIVEGIIDAISLHLSGIKAVAILSCGNFPRSFLATIPKKTHLVWGLDNDVAGTTAIKKHIAAAQELGFKNNTVSLLPAGDWNDVYKKGELNKTTIETAEFAGKLFLSKTPKEKAELLYKQGTTAPFYFDFGTWTFKANPNFDKDEKIMKDLKITKISSFTFDVLYHQINTSTQEANYVLSLQTKRGNSKSIFSGGFLANASDFKKRAISAVNAALFEGTTKDLNSLLTKKLENSKDVHFLNYVGYEKKFKTYIFNNLAFFNGRVFKKNKDDYFFINKTAIRGTDTTLNLNLSADSSQYFENWIYKFITAFQKKGIIALAFWVGSLFATQIRDIDQSFPFLEITGDPGTGKSTLIEFLWKLFGRASYEGLDPNKATLAGRGRYFSQVSNLPVVLIESDREWSDNKQKKFSWDELKTSYNGGNVVFRGVRTNDNETYEPPFRGSFVISQNLEILASDAILQRLVSASFSIKENSLAGAEASEYLANLSTDNVSYFLSLVLKKEQSFLNNFIEAKKNGEVFLKSSGEIKIARIIKNYAQVYACLEFLKSLFFDDGIKNKIELAKDKLKNLAINSSERCQGDNYFVLDFWDTFFYLENQKSNESSLNKSADPKFIAVNLNEYIALASFYKQQVPTLNELKTALKTSKKYKFLEIKDIRVGTSVRKCWIFTNPANLQGNLLDSEEKNLNKYF